MLCETREDHVCVRHAWHVCLASPQSHLLAYLTPSPPQLCSIARLAFGAATSWLGFAAFCLRSIGGQCCAGCRCRAAGIRCTGKGWDQSFFWGKSVCGDFVCLGCVSVNSVSVVGMLVYGELAIAKREAWKRIVQRLSIAQEDSRSPTAYWTACRYQW